jgi:hypothetical protein
MNAFKGITNLEPLFPEQYFEFKTQHYLYIKNVLLEIQVNRSTHPPSIAQVKERVQIHLYCSLVPSWQLIG